MNPLVQGKPGIKGPVKGQLHAKAQTPAKERVHDKVVAPENGTYEPAPKEKKHKPIQPPKIFQSLDSLNHLLRWVTVGVCGIVILVILLGRFRRPNRTYLANYRYKNPHYDPMELYRDPKFRKSEYVLLGANTKRRALFTTFQRLTRNMLILAPTGMGKSTFLENLILNFQLRDLPGFVVDPSGDRKFTGTLQNQAYACGRLDKLEVIDFDDPACKTIGLLYPFPNDNGLSIASRLLDGLNFSLDTAGSARHYLLLESKFVKYACQFLFIYSRRKGFVFRDVYNFIADEPFRTEVIARYMESKPNSILPQRFAVFADPKNKKFGEASHNTLATLEQFVLQDPIEDKVNDPDPDITFLGAAEQGKMVVFNIPVDRYQFDTRSLGRLILANLAGLLAYRNTIAKDWNYCLCAIDEFVAFGNASLFSLLSRNRKARLCLALATQSLGKLEEMNVHNTENLRSDLITQCRHRIVGYQDDDREAEYWSKRSRKVRITEESEMRQQGLFFQKRSGTIRREKEVPEFSSNIFKSFREGEFWLDFVQDADDRDPRGTYGQDLCFAPRLPFSQMPSPQDIIEREDAPNKPKETVKDPEDVMEGESQDDDTGLAAEIEHDKEAA